MNICSGLLGIGIVYGLMLVWAIVMDATYYKNGAPGHRPLKEQWTPGGGIYFSGKPPYNIEEKEDQ